jgi:energy-coupling factor transporter ATP-binding protein EcfA2
MVTLLTGKKGSGKTKKLIQLANEAVAASTGNVVVVEKGLKLTYDVTHKARLVDTDQYDINGYDALFGFLSGICAGNYDVTDILVDGTFKICPQGVDGLEEFVKKVSALADSAETKITLLISSAEEDLPVGINAVCEKV